MPPVPRFIQKPPTDPAGLRTGIALPYHLRPNDVLRMVEDLHDLLHDVNSLLVDRGYDRMEELLDPAGFSGFVSRTVVDRFERQSRQLVRNRYHNGYPDLLPRGAYAGDAVAHGTLGGLEVKASRGETSWQSHGPRAGWFCVVQFELDGDEAKALRDREPTRVRAVLIAELRERDWSWQPAREGRIRSGTASIKPSGVARLREGAVWVEPAYEVEHAARLAGALRDAWRANAAPGDCLAALAAAAAPLRAAEVVAAVAPRAGIPPEQLGSTVAGVLRKLVESGAVVKPERGRFAVA